MIARLSGTAVGKMNGFFRSIADFNRYAKRDKAGNYLRALAIEGEPFSLIINRLLDLKIRVSTVRFRPWPPTKLSSLHVGFLLLFINDVYGL